MFLSEILLIVALVVDAFIACFAYGTEGIRIPWGSALLIGGIGTSVLLLSMTLSAQFQRFLPAGICSAISFIIVLGIGIVSVFQNTVKNALAKRTDAKKNLHFQWAGISFAITVYLDETKADADHSKTLSLKEALVLGLVLSMDSFGIGFGSGFSPHNYITLFFLSIIIHPLAVLFGRFLGGKLSSRLPACLSSLGGFLLIALAVLRLL